MASCSNTEFYICPYSAPGGVCSDSGDILECLHVMDDEQAITWTNLEQCKDHPVKQALTCLTHTPLVTLQHRREHNPCKWLIQHVTTVFHVFLSSNLHYNFLFKSLCSSKSKTHFEKCCLLSNPFPVNTIT